MKLVDNAVLLGNIAYIITLFYKYNYENVYYDSFSKS